MRDTLHIALAQINPVVGDIAGNCAAIEAARRAAADQGADLLACPELAVSGAPLAALALHGGFLDAVEEGVARLAAGTADGGPALLATAPWRIDGVLHDAALLLDEGRLQEVRARAVPVPGEPYAEGRLAGPVAVRGVPLGLLLGADLDRPDVAETLQETGAEILLATAASPWLDEMPGLRLNLAVARVSETGLPLIWLNLLGGQDELVFDGGAFVLNADHGLALQAPAFRPGLPLTRWQRGAGGWACDAGIVEPPPEAEAALWQALLLGLRDQVCKNGHAGLRLDGAAGVGAALLAALAVDAFGEFPGAGSTALALSSLDKTALALGEGAMAGDFAPFKDLHEGQLRRLARWRNRSLPAGALGPAGAVVAAELLVETGGADPAALLQALLDGQPADTAEAAAFASAFFVAERARRRAPPGLRLSRSLLGRDRLYPMTNAFRGSNASGGGREAG